MNAATAFADLPDDLDFSTESVPLAPRHPFEAKGLGVAPFKCTGVDDNEGVKLLGNPRGFAYNCHFCGTSIRYEFEIISSDGKHSVVGSDCIALAKGDVIGFKHFDREIREKKARAAKVRKGERLVAAVEKFKKDQPAVWEWLETNRFKTPFATSLIEWLVGHGNLTPGQIGAVERNIEKAKAFEAERPQREAAKAHAAQVRELAAPVVDCKKLHEAFAKAGKSLKYPKITLGEITVSPAGANSKNPGAIYVKRGRRFESPYLGKIVDGKFLASRDCTPEEEAHIVELVNDPMRTAEAYGLRTGNCCMCGRDLVDPDSVARGIGPICAEKYGW